MRIVALCIPLVLPMINIVGVFFLVGLVCVVYLIVVALCIPMALPIKIIIVIFLVGHVCIVLFTVPGFLLGTITICKGCHLFCFCFGTYLYIYIYMVGEALEIDFGVSFLLADASIGWLELCSGWRESLPAFLESFLAGWSLFLAGWNSSWFAWGVVHHVIC